MEQNLGLFLRHAAVAVGGLTLSACHGASAPVPGDDGDHQPFHAIAVGETVEAIGTEPFWRLRVVDGVLVLSEPSAPRGRSIAVSRFAGRGGVSFSGTLEDQDVTLAVTQGQCSNGMSERIYPFTATLRVGAQLRNGCAWSGSTPARPGSSPT